MITDGNIGKGALRKSTIVDAQSIPNVAIFLKRTTIEFLQILFSQRAEGSYHYDKDDTRTEIQISDQHTADLEAIHVRPAIVGVRGPLSWQGLGLGGNAFEQQSRTTGNTTFNDLLTGSVAFSCLSREGTEAEQLAHLVFNSFKFFRPVLQKYGFFSIKSLNIGSESLIVQEGDDDDLYLVPVYVTAQIQDRWTLTDDAARKLEKIITEVLTSP
ncbi:MAG: hypothetical protein EB078_11235 [Proteobacteria bacterium]|nr:hypothetical protein [Pseudomonadota bacterium]NDD05471.1 hypothetical protein [Pseudomonadota bacterium]